MTKYGLFVDGLLIETHELPEEAYEEAIRSYESTGLFYEVREVRE